MNLLGIYMREFEKGTFPLMIGYVYEKNGNISSNDSLLYLWLIRYQVYQFTKMVLLWSLLNFIFFGSMLITLYVGIRFLSMVSFKYYIVIYLSFGLLVMMQLEVVRELLMENIEGDLLEALIYSAIYLKVFPKALLNKSWMTVL